MAIFSNQATLTYNGGTVSSNVVFGELVDSLAADKTVLESSYSPGALLTYVVTLRNTGAASLTGLTVTDDLGGYPFGGATLYPLAFEPGTAAVFVNGIPAGAPAVVPGQPLTVSALNVPAGGSTVLIYQARVTDFAQPGTGGTIVNSVTISGSGLTSPITASAAIAGADQPALSVTKSLSPAQVSDNDRLTYTFLIRNFGSQPVVATDNAVISDTFSPILSGLTVTFEGTVWTQGIQYNYNQATGLFTTALGQITVPGATVTQDPITGEYTLTPGAVTLTVTGTV